VTAKNSPGTGEALPKISVVTACFNAVDFIEDAIESVISQKYPAVEHIVMDGGSRDGSLDKIRSYGPRLHRWVSEPDKGQYDAINKGFAIATGDIMAWLNSDDMYCPWTLHTVASIMTDCPEVEWLTSLSPIHWDYEGYCLGCQSIPGFSRKSFLDGCHVETSGGAPFSYIQQESTFWRRSLWEKAGGYVSTEHGTAGDFDLWCRFFRHAQLHGTDSPLGGFRTRVGQLSKDGSTYRDRAMESLQTFRSETKWRPSPTGSFLRRTQWHRLPKIRTVARKFFGYSGNRVGRVGFDRPNGKWETGRYVFLT
jgi:hypothetical protein